MMWPNPISGHDRQSKWLNRLMECFKARRIASGPGYKVKQTTGGIYLEIDPDPTSTEAGCPPTEFEANRFINDLSGCHPSPTGQEPHDQLSQTFSPSGTVTLGAPIPMGFKAVQSRKAWHGRFGFLDLDTCQPPQDPKPAAQQVKYLRIRREASATIEPVPDQIEMIKTVREYEVDRSSGIVTEIEAQNAQAPQSSELYEWLIWVNAMVTLYTVCGQLRGGTTDAQNIVDAWAGIPDSRFLQRSLSDTVIEWSQSVGSVFLHAKITLSVPYYASRVDGQNSVQKDIEDMLALWPLNDDALYPWRTDAYATIAPMVRVDEKPLPTSPDQWNAVGYVDQSGYTGRMIGSPLPAGYEGYWQAQHVNLEYNQGNGSWTIRDYGAWTPGFLPLNTTEWSTKQEAADIFWPGASTECKTTGVFYAQKWAETVLPRQAYDYGRPRARDRFLPDETTLRCIVAAPGGVVEISGTDPGWQTGDACVVTLGVDEDYDGVWLVTRQDATHYVLAQLAGDIPSWWNRTVKNGTMGKLRWWFTVSPDAPAGIASSEPRGDFIQLLATSDGRASSYDIECITENVDPDGCVPCVLFTPNGETVDGGLTLALLWCGGDQTYGRYSRQWPRLYVDDPFWQAAAAPCGGAWFEDPGDGTGDYAHRPFVEARCAPPSGAPALPGGLTLACMAGECLLPAHVGVADGEPAPFSGELALWLTELDHVCASAPDGAFVQDYERNGVTTDFCP